MFLSRFALWIIYCALAASAASLTGVVKDSTGAAVGGAVVTVSVNPPQGNPRTVRTDGAGAFHIDGLTAGTYRVHIALPGFEAFDKEVTLEESKVAALEIMLKLAEVKQQIDMPGGFRAAH